MEAVKALIEGGDAEGAYRAALGTGDDLLLLKAMSVMGSGSVALLSAETRGELLERVVRLERESPVEEVLFQCLLDACEADLFQQFSPAAQRELLAAVESCPTAAASPAGQLLQAFMSQNCSTD